MRSVPHTILSHRRSIHRRSRGFSLVELMGVVAIIVLLVSISLPVINNLVKRARVAVDTSNFRQVLLSLQSYNAAHEHYLASKDMTTANACAEVLSKEGYLNTAKILFSTNDPKITAHKAASKAIPQFIGIGQGADWKVADGFVDLPLSVVFITDIDANAPASTTPLIYTRGLGHDGYWAKDSVYLGDGGLIGFADGHVEFRHNLKDDENQLVDYATGKPTIDIQKAATTGAKAFGTGTDW